jgi:hypothetical protein
MKKTKEQLVEQILAFMQEHGKVDCKSSNPVMAHLEMSYNSKILSIKTCIYIHCMGNGSCQVEVVYNGCVVLKANGNMMGKPFNVKFETYKPGIWESKIKIK